MYVHMLPAYTIVARISIGSLMTRLAALVWQVIEWICVAQFTVEYVVRMSVCTRRPGEAVLADNGDVLVDHDGMPLRRRDFFSYATAVRFFAYVPPVFACAYRFYFVGLRSL
eukprot:COSAG01_NODE_2069_length_8498_cov_5.965841_11_plen_112_part_00